MAMSTETQELWAAEWLKRLPETEAADETLVEHTRRLGLKWGKAYRSKRHLRRTGQWPVSGASFRGTNSLVRSKLRFARVRIAQKAEAMSLSVWLKVQLINGRRPEMTIMDEDQLSRVLRATAMMRPDAQVAVFICVAPVDMPKAATLALIVEQTLVQEGIVRGIEAIFGRSVSLFGSAKGEPDRRGAPDTG